MELEKAHNEAVDLNQTSYFQKDMPWNQCVSSQLKDMHWWNYEFESPALMLRSQLIRLAQVTVAKDSPGGVVTTVDHGAGALVRAPPTVPAEFTKA